MGKALCSAPCISTARPLCAVLYASVRSVFHLSSQIDERSISRDIAQSARGAASLEPAASAKLSAGFTSVYEAASQRE